MASSETVEPGSFIPLAESTAANHDLKKSRLLTYSAIIITKKISGSRSRNRFLLRFRLMKEREALPKEPSMAEKVGCHKDSGHP